MIRRAAALTLSVLCITGSANIQPTTNTVLVQTVRVGFPTAVRVRSQVVKLPAGFTAWRTSRAARLVRHCESTDNYRAHSGQYLGAWQMDHNFWKSYGGTRYAVTPLTASVLQQDLVAFHGWLARGWEPWTCARIVGVS